LAYTELGLLIYSNKRRSVTKINKGSIAAVLHADALPPVSNGSKTYRCDIGRAYGAE